jgi:hypothetical protein
LTQKVHDAVVSFAGAGVFGGVAGAVGAVDGASTDAAHPAAVTIAATSNQLESRFCMCVSDGVAMREVE